MTRKATHPFNGVNDDDDDNNNGEDVDDDEDDDDGDNEKWLTLLMEWMTPLLAPTSVSTTSAWTPPPSTWLKQHQGLRPPG